MQLTIADNVDNLQEQLASLMRTGQSIALVPTMGALHAGHIALVKHAKTLADAVIVSIFVNPMQFGAGEDLAKYPRSLDADIQKLTEAGAAIVYTPSQEDIYPAGFTTSVSPGALGHILCGKSRPGHFDGVATIVTKLLLRTLPYQAVFGEKDYQQLCIIRRLVTDLDIPVEIVGLPTVRENDGLAMSSRNSYLTPAERQIAPALYEILKVTGDNLRGSMSTADALENGRQLLTNAGFKVDYLELRHADTLEDMPQLEMPARLLAAVWLGKTRLIDNIPLE